MEWERKCRSLRIVNGFRRMNGSVGRTNEGVILWERKIIFPSTLLGSWTGDSVIKLNHYINRRKQTKA